MAVVCLAAGIGVLIAFCHGATGIQLAFPLSAASVHVDITTTGIPAILGFVLTAAGAFLLIVATVIALVGLLSRSGHNSQVKRRENAFEE
jgi:hypothetical protein